MVSWAVASGACFGAGFLLGRRREWMVRRRAKMVEERTSKCDGMITGSDLLTCPLCQELFTLPVIIPCGHSFCLMCVVMLRDAGLWSCPLCREDIKAALSGLPINYSLKACVEERARESENGKELLEDLNKREADAYVRFAALRRVDATNSRVHREEMERPVVDSVSEMAIQAVVLVTAFTQALDDLLRFAKLFYHPPLVQPLRWGAWRLLKFVRVI